MTDHITEYLALRGMTSVALFDTFYGLTDAAWLHRRWREGALLPARLNNWCKERVHDIRIEQRGLKIVA